MTMQKRCFHTALLTLAQQKQGGKFRETAAATQAAARAKRQQRSSRQQTSQQKRTNAGNQVESASKSIGPTPAWTEIKQPMVSARDLPSLSSLLSKDASRPTAFYMEKESLNEVMQPLLSSAGLTSYQHFALEDLPLVFRPCYASLFATCENGLESLHLLDGPARSGKSTAMAVLMQMARQNKDAITLFVDASDICAGRYPIELDASKSLYQQNELAQRYLTLWSRQYQADFESILLGGDISVRTHQFKAGKTSLFQLCQIGKAEVATASAVLSTVLTTLAHQTLRPVRLFVDRANPLFTATAYKDQEARTIVPTQLALVDTLFSLWRGTEPHHLKTVAALSRRDTHSVIQRPKDALTAHGLTLSAVHDIPTMSFEELNVLYKLMMKQRMMTLQLTAHEQTALEHAMRLQEVEEEAAQQEAGTVTPPAEKGQTTERVEDLVAKQTAWAKATPSAKQALYRYFQ